MATPSASRGLRVLGLALGPWLCSLCVKTCASGQSRGWGTQTWLRTEGGEELAQATSVRGWGWGRLGGRRHLERWLHESACQAWFQDSRQLAIRLSLESRVESRKRSLELPEGCQEGSSRCECGWASVQVGPGSLASPLWSPSWPQAGLTWVSTILCRTPPFHLSPSPGEKVRKNQNKATTVPVPPASAALPKYPKTLPPSLPLKLWPVWQVGRESYFTDGETEDQTGERPRPWHPQVRESGPEHRALPPPPELGTGRKLGIAQGPGWAGGVTVLGSARKSLELGLQHRGGDVSHFPCDPRLQTKAGRELFL